MTPAHCGVDTDGPPLPRRRPDALELANEADHLRRLGVIVGAVAIALAAGCGADDSTEPGPGEPVPELSDRVIVELASPAPATPSAPFELDVTCLNGIQPESPPLVIAEFPNENAGELNWTSGVELASTVVRSHEASDNMLVGVFPDGTVPPGRVDLRVACSETSGVWGGISLEVPDYSGVGWRDLVPVAATVEFQPGRLVGDIECPTDSGLTAIFGVVASPGEATPQEIEARSKIVVEPGTGLTIRLDDPLDDDQRETNTVMMLCSADASSTALTPRIYEHNIFYRNS